MNKSNLIIFLIALLLSACGENSQQKALREKALTDSVQRATVNRMEQKETLQKNLAELQQKKTQIKTRLEQYRAELIVQNEKMKEVKEPQLSRLLSSAAEKDEEIRSQALVVQKLRDAITDLEQAAQETDSKISETQSSLQTY